MPGSNKKVTHMQTSKPAANWYKPAAFHFQKPSVNLFYHHHFCDVINFFSFLSAKHPDHVEIVSSKLLGGASCRILVKFKNNYVIVESKKCEDRAI